MSSVLAVDQGTTGTKSFRLNDEGEFSLLFQAQHKQIYPWPGWVEHDPLELVHHVERAAAAGLTGERPSGIGLGNQGETVIAWHSRTKEPVYNAIVWQDQRTAGMLDELKQKGMDELTLDRAGLPLDPYFSAGKLRWLIDNAPEAGSLLNKGLLRLGTSEVYFLDRLAGEYATDVTTASRTSLMNLETLQWDPELCKLFGVPIEALPEIRPTTGNFGRIEVDSVSAPVTASVVDQQAALFGHRCFTKGMAKITFGTGAFALANAGREPVRDDKAGLVATVGWQLSGQKQVYAVDGGLYSAASAVNWLKRIGLFHDFEELNELTPPPACDKGLFFVPALSGLACPHWDRNAAGLWIGLDLDTGRHDLVKAVLEGIAFRAAELINALSGLVGSGTAVSIDGGVTNNAYFCDILSSCLEREVRVPDSTEITALGAGYLALLGAGLFDRPESLPQVVEYRRRHQPSKNLRFCQQRFSLAVERAKSWRVDRPGDPSDAN